MSQYEWTSIWFLFPETEVFSIWKMTLEGTVTRQPPTAIACACEMYFFLQPRLLPNSHITTSFSLFPFRFLIPFLYLSLSLPLSRIFSLFFFLWFYDNIHHRKTRSKGKRWCTYILFLLGFYSCFFSCCCCWSFFFYTYIRR